MFIRSRGTFVWILCCDYSTTDSQTQKKRWCFLLLITTSLSSQQNIKNNKFQHWLIHYRIHKQNETHAWQLELLPPYQINPFRSGNRHGVKDLYRFPNLSDVFWTTVTILNMNLPHSCVTVFLQLCLLTGPHLCTMCVCVCVSSHRVWCKQDIPKPAKRKCQNTSAQPAMNINALSEKERGRERQRRKYHLSHPKGEYMRSSRTL